MKGGILLYRLGNQYCSFISTDYQIYRGVTDILKKHNGLEVIMDKEVGFNEDMRKLEIITLELKKKLNNADYKQNLNNIINEYQEKYLLKNVA